MRKGSFFEDLIQLPWPVGVVLAVLVFFAFHTYQLVAPQTQVGLAVQYTLKIPAYLLIGVLLLASFLSFLTQKIRSKRFRTTRSMSDLRSLSWRQFESFVGEYFREQGYFVMVTPEGPDNGVDLVLRKDGEKTYVQCKHWKTNVVGVEKVRELLGAISAGGAQNGIFVASGTYTNPAKEFAQQCGIKLIGRDELAVLLNSSQQNHELDHGSSSEDQEITCPKCSAPMVRRVATKGANQGNTFWGCSKFPQCRGIRPFLDT